MSIPRSWRLGIASLVGVWMIGAILYWRLRPHEDERVVEVLTAPNDKFTVVVTKTREHWPYGVEGHVYLADAAGGGRTRVVSYFVDDVGELMSYFRWDNDRQAFAYRGQIGGVILLSPDHAPRPEERR